VQQLGKDAGWQPRIAHRSPADGPSRGRRPAARPRLPGHRHAARCRRRIRGAPPRCRAHRLVCWLHPMDTPVFGGYYDASVRAPG
jgi:hypothetical protein